MNSNTLRTISSPVGICHIKSSTLTAFSAMWRLLAVSSPFCIGGTRAAAAAHSAVIAVSREHKPTRLGLTHTTGKHKTN